MKPCSIVLVKGQDHKRRRNDLAKAFAEVAERQKERFYLHPWKDPRDFEDDDVVMLVAARDLRDLREAAYPTRDTDVCGWLTAIAFDDHVFLSELSSRSFLERDDPAYVGIGKRLFDALVSWCRRNQKRYVSLVPINDVVSDVYERWGCRPMRIGDRLKSNTLYFAVDESFPTAEDESMLRKDAVKEAMREISVYLTERQSARLASLDDALFERIVTDALKLRNVERQRRSFRDIERLMRRYVSDAFATRRSARH